MTGDNNYFGRAFGQLLADSHLVMLRWSARGEASRAGKELFKPLRQVIEPVN